MSEILLPLDYVNTGEEDTEQNRQKSDATSENMKQNNMQEAIQQQQQMQHSRPPQLAPAQLRTIPGQPTRPSLPQPRSSLGETFIIFLVRADALLYQFIVCI